MDSTELSELDAAQLYLRMVNELDPEPFIARLAADVRYVSQWVIEELSDAGRVAALLREKVQAAHRSAVRDRARLGVASTHEHGRPLAILYEGGRPAASVEFSVRGSRITQIAIGIPGVHEPRLLDDVDVERFRTWFPTSAYATRKRLS